MPRADKAPKIAFVGEAWGGDEEYESRRAGRAMPFVGAAGKLFNTFLSTIGIERRLARVKTVGKTGKLEIEEPDSIWVTNVFNEQPERNKIENLFTTRKESWASERCKEWPPLKQGKYLDPGRLKEIDRLFYELDEFEPDVIVAMGATPLWALCRVTGIMKRRGGWHEARIGKRIVPVIPTIHPAAVLRSFVWFVLVAHDLERAVAVARGRKPERWKYIAEPTLTDLAMLKTLPGPLAADIETIPAFRAITCVGIGNRDTAICIPFVDHRQPGRSYWKSAKDELRAVGAMAACLEDRKRAKIFHNGGYDITWLREIYGIEVAGAVSDTRLMHHALWPELPHDLWTVVSTPILVEPWKQDYTSMKSDD